MKYVILKDLREEMPNLTVQQIKDLLSMKMDNFDGRKNPKKWIENNS